MPLPPYVDRARRRGRPRALPDGVRPPPRRRRRADRRPALHARAPSTALRAQRRRHGRGHAARRLRHVRARPRRRPARPPRRRRDGSRCRPRRPATLNERPARPAAASSPSARPRRARSRRPPTPTGASTRSTGPTDLTVTPGYRFRAVDALLTNFHLPQSSLLVLTATFGGTRGGDGRVPPRRPRGLSVLLLRRLHADRVTGGAARSRRRARRRRCEGPDGPGDGRKSNGLRRSGHGRGAASPAPIPGGLSARRANRAASRRPAGGGAYRLRGRGC